MQYNLATELKTLLVSNESKHTCVHLSFDFYTGHHIDKYT